MVRRCKTVRRWRQSKGEFAIRAQPDALFEPGAAVMYKLANRQAVQHLIRHKDDRGAARHILQPVDKSRRCAVKPLSLQGAQRSARLHQPKIHRLHKAWDRAASAQQIAHQSARPRPHLHQPNRLGSPHLQP